MYISAIENSSTSSYIKLQTKVYIYLKGIELSSLWEFLTDFQNTHDIILIIFYIKLFVTVLSYIA